MSLLSKVRDWVSFFWNAEKFAYRIVRSDEQLALSAFIRDGGDPWEIADIERAYLGEVIDPDACVSEATGKGWDE